MLKKVADCHVTLPIRRCLHFADEVFSPLPTFTSVAQRSKHHKTSKWCSRGKPPALRESIDPAEYESSNSKTDCDDGHAVLTDANGCFPSYNRYLAIAARVVRRSLKDDMRIAAERRGDMDLRFAKWSVGYASPVVLFDRVASSRIRIGR